MLQLTVTRLVASSVLLFGVVLVSPRSPSPSGRVANTLSPAGPSSLCDFPSPWRDRPPWLVVLCVRQIPGLAATDCLLFGSEEALDDLRQHRLDGERVVGGVRHDCELVCGPQ